LQAGVNVTGMRLAEHGIYGNGRIVMIEKNNLEIAALLRLDGSVSERAFAGMTNKVRDHL
jgi:hypothetical protein